MVSRATKPKISPGEELKWPSSPQPGRKPAESEITSGLQGTAAGSKLASQKDPVTAPIPEEATTKKKKKKKITAEGMGDGLTQQGMLEPPKKSLAPEEPAAPRKKKKRKGTDRKSTRLNSSHLVISYAVFCLKKKQQTTRAHQASIPHEHN